MLQKFCIYIKIWQFSWAWRNTSKSTLPFIKIKKLGGKNTETQLHSVDLNCWATTLVVYWNQCFAYHPRGSKKTLYALVCVSVCLRACVTKVTHSVAPNKHNLQSFQSDWTASVCWYHAPSLTSRHRDEIVHVQGFLWEGPRQQLGSKDGVLLRRQLQRTPQEPQPRRPPPQQRRGGGLQLPSAGDLPAAALGLQSAVNNSTSTCNLSFAPRHFRPLVFNVVQMSFLTFNRAILELEYLRWFKSEKYIPKSFLVFIFVQNWDSYGV